MFGLLGVKLTIIVSNNYIIRNNTFMISKSIVSNKVIICNNPLSAIIILFIVGIEAIFYACTFLYTTYFLFFSYSSMMGASLPSLFLAG